MQLAANLSLLYSDLAVAERFRAAAADGFRFIEILLPYDESPQWYAQQLEQYGLQLVLINTPTVDTKYPVGLAAQPEQRQPFRDGLDRAADVCQATGCRAVHVLAGRIDSDYSRDEQIATLRDNLSWAQARYPDLDFHLEALNSTDVPDYLYARPEQVADILMAHGPGQVGMQFDYYHVVKEGQSLVEQLDKHFRFVKHVQIAGAPDRLEPDLGRDGMLAGIKRLNDLGYKGYIGLEYRPARTVREGLAWVHPLIEQGVVQQ